MKFRVEGIEIGLKKDSFLPAVRSYRPRRICIYLSFAAVSLKSSLGISKELRKQRIFREWKIECASINKTKERIGGGSLNLVQGVEGQFRRGLEEDTNNAKDFQESHDLIYCCRGSIGFMFVGTSVSLSGVSLNWGEYAKYYKLIDETSDNRLSTMNALTLLALLSIEVPRIPNIIDYRPLVKF